MRISQVLNLIINVHFFILGGVTSFVHTHTLMLHDTELKQVIDIIVFTTIIVQEK